jgi:hypothetical protein
VAAGADTAPPQLAYPAFEAHQKALMSAPSRCPIPGETPRLAPAVTRRSF